MFGNYILNYFLSNTSSMTSMKILNFIFHVIWLFYPSWKSKIVINFFFHLLKSSRKSNVITKHIRLFWLRSITEWFIWEICFIIIKSWRKFPHLESSRSSKHFLDTIWLIFRHFPWWKEFISFCKHINRNFWVLTFPNLILLDYNQELGRGIIWILAVALLLIMNFMWYWERKLRFTGLLIRNYFYLAFRNFKEGSNLNRASSLFFRFLLVAFTEIENISNELFFNRIVIIMHLRITFCWVYQKLVL